MYLSWYEIYLTGTLICRKGKFMTIYVTIVTGSDGTNVYTT